MAMYSNNFSLTHVNADYYTRRYILNSNEFNGIPVIVYAECSQNSKGLNNHYYYLDIFFSVDDIPNREHLIGVTFGTGKMDKDPIDREIDRWVYQMVNEESFPLMIKEYLRSYFG